jgi:bifunctional DNase/RNase
MNAVCVAMAVVLPALGAGGQEAGEDLVPVEVAQVLGTDPMPWVVELESAQGGAAFAFRVTEAEAIAITLEARGEQTERPMSPAFVSLVAEAAGLGLTAVVLQRPQRPMGTCGWLWVEGPKGAYPVEVRGGDGVAIALHAQIPLRVADVPGGADPAPPETGLDYGFTLCEYRPGAPPDDISRAVSLKAADGRLFGFLLSLDVADSIWLGMERPFMPRARIHDAVALLLKGADVPVRRLVIGRIEGGTIYGTLVLGVDGQEVEVDCRPSDGITVALRMKAPIFVTSDSAAALRPMPDARPAEPPKPGPP